MSEPLSPVEVAEQKLDAAHAKVAKLEAHLDGARQAVADAEADLKAARASVPEAVEHSGEVTYAHAEHASGIGAAGSVGG